MKTTTSRLRATVFAAFTAVLLLAAPFVQAQGLLDTLKKGNSAKAIDSPVNPEVELTLVLVPWPCPSMEMYKVAEVNMDAFLALMALNDATPDTFQCVIVQAPYAAPEHVDTIQSDDWWGPVIRETTKRYSFYVELGFLRFVETLSPEFKESIGFEFTPSYYIFNAGQLVDSGNIVELLENFSAQ